MRSVTENVQLPRPRAFLLLLCTYKDQFRVTFLPPQYTKNRCTGDPDLTEKPRTYPRLRVHLQEKCSSSRWSRGRAPALVERSKVDGVLTRPLKSVPVTNYLLLLSLRIE